MPTTGRRFRSSGCRTSRSSRATKDLTEKDIIGATDDGVLIKGDGSYSIDHQRYNFQFSGQTFWEVKNGQDHHAAARRRLSVEHAGVLEVVRHAGRQATYVLGGAFNDGKGQPGQSNAVSHGCPIARFARVNVLNTGR